MTLMKKLLIVVLTCAVSVAGFAPVLAQDVSAVRVPEQIDLFLAALELTGETLDIDPVLLLGHLEAERTTLTAIGEAQGVSQDALAAVLIESLGFSEENARLFLTNEFPLDPVSIIFGDAGFGTATTDDATIDPMTQLILAITLQTDLTTDEVRARLDAGESLAEIAESAGLDVDVLIAQIQAGVDLLAAMNPDLEGIRAVEDLGTSDMIDVIINSDAEGLQMRIQRTLVVDLTVVGVMADTLGMTRLEIRAGLESGETFAAFIERHEGDVEAVQAAAAAQLADYLAAYADLGLLGELDADLMAKSADTAVAEILYRTTRALPLDPYGILEG